MPLSAQTTPHANQIPEHQCTPRLLYLVSTISSGMQTVPCFVLFRRRLDLAKARASRLFELLAEHEELDLVVDGQHTSTGDTTENVGTSTLEERLDTLLGNDLAGGIEGRLVLDGL